MATTEEIVNSPAFKQEWEALLAVARETFSTPSAQDALILSSGRKILQTLEEQNEKLQEKIKSLQAELELRQRNKDYLTYLSEGKGP